MRWAACSRIFDEEGEGDNNHPLTRFTCEKAQLLGSLPHAHTLRGLGLARNRQNTENDGMDVAIDNLGRKCNSQRNISGPPCCMERAR